MIYLLMWLTDSCLQIYSTNSKGTSDNNLESKERCKDQELIQSSTTPDPGYQWESDKLTEDTQTEPRGQPFPSR